MKTILVTGVGAIIGYGILRSLRRTSRNLRLIGADINSDAVGQAWCDHFVTAPLTAQENYSQWLLDRVRKSAVDLIIPGIEQDVLFLSDHPALVRDLGCQVVLNTASLIQVCRDKWKMDEALRALGSEVRIPAYRAGEFSELANTLGLPFILKPRSSYASKGLIRVQREADFNRWADQLGSHLIAQPIIGADEDEHTVAVFGDGTGTVSASITLQRRLASDGSTAKAWVRSHPSLDRVVAKLCAHFKPEGPTNLQFRLDRTAWKLLEINPRISSSTSIRAAFGYNEADLAVRYYLDRLPINQPVTTSGFAARYLEDYIIPEGGRSPGVDGAPSDR